MTRGTERLNRHVMYTYPCSLSMDPKSEPPHRWFPLTVYTLVWLSHCHILPINWWVHFPLAKLDVRGKSKGLKKTKYSSAVVFGKERHIPLPHLTRSDQISPYLWRSQLGNLTAMWEHSWGNINVPCWWQVRLARESSNDHDQGEQQAGRKGTQNSEETEGSTLAQGPPFLTPWGSNCSCPIQPHLLEKELAGGGSNQRVWAIIMQKRQHYSKWCFQGRGDRANRGADFLCTFE